MGVGERAGVADVRHTYTHIHTHTYIHTHIRTYIYIYYIHAYT